VNGEELDALGWRPFFAEAWAAEPRAGLVPAWVGAPHTRLLRLQAAEGERLAGTVGRLRHRSRGPEDRPAVGDWVAAVIPASGQRATVHAVLPRRTAFVRRAAGDVTALQVLAANVDTVFLVMGLDRDFNPRRLERALVLAWESGAEPVVLLNKADVCDDVPARLSEAQASAGGVPVLVLAAKAGQGMGALAPWLSRGRTVALLGSSGVGKSTIVNRLLGEERQRTREVRESDQRGRHTTTHRELVTLAGGGLLLDTPGLRELQLWASDEGLAATFEDVLSLAPGCRFRDCAHREEPGCAVQAAVAAGRLPAGRLASYQKLEAELRSIEIRADPDLRREQRQRWRIIHKAVKASRPRE
jgi:ribosome biogenesis GTPase / thiamine phosphate phosphatase